MALETGTYISDLVSTNPVGTDTLDKADDHLRLLKSTLQATFPSVVGPTLATASGGAVTPGLQIAGLTNTNSAQGLYRYSADANPSRLVLSKSRGATSGVHTVVASADNLGYVSFAGSDGTNFIEAARIEVDVDGTPGTNDMPGRIILSTTADGASSPTERMRIDNAGNVGIGRTVAAGYKLQTSGTIGANDGTVEVFMAPVATSSASIIGNVSNHALVLFTNNTERLRIDTSGNVLVTGAGGLGYGTGSGGSVTQLTSKTTGVTLNKSNGVITMNNAALAAGASASFVVTNSVITAWDTVVVKPSNSNYRAHATDNVAGSFTVIITNISGGSLSDAIQLSFTILRTVAA